MDISVIINSVGTALAYLFPTLGEYIKILSSTIVTMITILGLFTNILPEPGHVYPVPDVEDLQAQLGENKGLILKIARTARKITVTVNWFVATAIYGWIYNGLAKVSSYLPSVKRLTPVPAKG